MQYSLKTLMLATSVLAILAALISKFEGVGLLGGFVLILASLICYYFSKLPLPDLLANGILLGSMALHLVLISFVFPMSATWVNEAMNAAEARRGQKFYVESHAETMLGFMVVFGYFPALIALVIRSLSINIWECTGFSRLGLSLWLLFLPFIAVWCTVHHYNNF